MYSINDIPFDTVLLDLRTRDNLFYHYNCNNLSFLCLNFHYTTNHFLHISDINDILLQNHS